MALDELILQKLDDLCARISKMEEKLDNHIAEKTSRTKTKKDFALIAIAVVSTGAAVYGVLT